MTSKTASLRKAYEDGYEIVVIGGSVNPGRPDGRYPVLYTPRSSTDKSPWVRADGFPFRYNGGELEVIKPAGWRFQLTPEAAALMAEAV